MLLDDATISKEFADIKKSGTFRLRHLHRLIVHLTTLLLEEKH